VRGLSGALAALYAIPALRYLAGRRAEPADAPLDVAALDGLPEGVPQRFPLHGRAADAWSTDGGARAAIFLVRRGDEVRAFDSTCPHTGCAVGWDAEHGRFRCPCHKSEFALDGARVSGPAPRDLDGEEVEVRGGRVCVRYRRYRPGRPDRVS
jgi:Rieske Fe-S protein